MKAFITGASGFVGSHVAQVLARKGFQLRALVRPTSRVSHLLDLDCTLIFGDVRNKKDVKIAMSGCEVGFHVAADYRIWVPDPEQMFAINVSGTENVLAVAKHLGLKKLVYTSTVGALGTCRGEIAANENTPVTFDEMVGPYKKSKFLAEQVAMRFAQEGVPVVIVNPTTPVGPGDWKPTPTGKIIVDFLNRKMPAFLETGLNLVDVRDIALGHWLALDMGKTGEKYILGNQNLSLAEIFMTLEKISGNPAPRFQLPYYPVLLGAYVNDVIAKATKKPPLIPLDGVRMAKKHMFFDASKAVRGLGLPQTPISKALEDAVHWFRKNGYIEN